MTTANVLDNTSEAIQDLGNEYQPALPLAMGAGYINPNQALDPDLIYDPTLEDHEFLVLHA